MKDFRELKVWEKSHHLTLKVYRTTVKFPKEEFGEVTNEIIEIKKMLASFMRKLKADR